MFDRLYTDIDQKYTGIPKTSYNRELTAVGYIDWDGDGTDVQYTHDNASEDVNSVAVTNLSIADVALAVMELPATTEAQKTELKNYINNYTVTFIYAYGNADEQTVAYSLKTNPRIKAVILHGISPNGFAFAISYILLIETLPSALKSS